jgi:hypothetical protein
VTTRGRQDAHPAGIPLRVVQVIGGSLLALDLAITLAVYERLPQTIAVHWSATGVADNAGDRALAWLLPMTLGFSVALGLVARRHTKSDEQGLLAGVVLLAALYLFSGSMLLLLANVDNSSWQEGSVAGRWMLLTLTLPGLTFAAGLLFYRARSRRR